MSFTKDLLSFINEVGELLPQQRDAYLLLRKVYAPTYYKSLERLEKQRLIKKIKNDKKQTAYVITPNGLKILTKSLPKQRRNDGLRTLITYDIPSDKNRQRTIFRRYLISNGFTLIQKSLLISPNKFDDHLKEVMNELKISKYVKIVSGRFDYIKLD